MKTKKHKITRRSKYYHHFFSAIILVIIIAGLATIYKKNIAEAAPASTVYFEPASVTKNLSESFSLDAKINPGTNEVSAVEIHVTFDSTRIRLNSVTPNTATGGFPDVLSAASIDNNAGTATIILGAGSSGYVTTPATTMATFTFTGLAAGSSNVAFPDTTVAAAHGEGSTNVIITRTPASITINARTYTVTDWQRVANNWLQDATGEDNGDYNGDGKANTRDIGIIMHGWQ